MPIPNRAAYFYGDNQVFLPRWPHRPPEDDDVGVGSRSISAAGIQTAYEVRRDSMVTITQRYDDDEWPAIRDFIRYGQRSHAPFIFRPDRNNENEEYVCYLHSPAMNENLGRSRLRSPRHQQVTITLRSISGDFDLRYWDAPASG